MFTDDVIVCGANVLISNHKDPGELLSADRKFAGLKVRSVAFLYNNSNEQVQF